MTDEKTIDLTEEEDYAVGEPEKTEAEKVEVDQAAEDAKKAASDVAEAAKAADEDHAKSPMIPKARFDEVNNELKGLRSRLDAMDAQKAAAEQAASVRDFDAERAALKARYAESGEIDMDEYLDLRDALTRDEARFAAEDSVTKITQENARRAAAQSWVSKINDWQAVNAEFLSNSIRRDAVSRLIETLGADGMLSDDALIAKVEAEAFEAFGYASAKSSANQHASRNAADAAATARASAGQHPPSGAAGNRGRGADGGFMSASTKDWKSLTKQQQNEKLGIADDD